MYNYYRPRRVRALRGHDAPRSSATRRASTTGEPVDGLALAVRAHDRPVEPGDIACDDAVGPAGDGAGARHRRPPVPVPARARSIPASTCGALAADPAGVARDRATRRRAAAPARCAPTPDLFCMGAAFLLLETKSVVQFALLFGTTWFVNSLVFAGILLAVLAAVEVARRVRLPSPGVLYGAAARLRSWWPGSCRPPPARRSPSCPGSLASVGRRVRAGVPREPDLRAALQRTWARRRSRSARTCSARWSAACSSTWRS